MPGLLNMSLEQGQSAIDTAGAASRLAEDQRQRDMEARSQALTGIGSAIGTAGGLMIAKRNAQKANDDKKKPGAQAKDDGSTETPWTAPKSTLVPINDDAAGGATPWTAPKATLAPPDTASAPASAATEDNGLSAMIGSLWHKLYSGF